MKGFVGITDNDWFAFLSQKPDIDEVNFWQPGGSRRFRSLQPGEPFLFKLHAPQHFIVGGGFFAHNTILPVSLAWEAFGEKNGAASLREMRRRIERYRRQAAPSTQDYYIGCIILTQPFFFQRHNWIAVPPDFSRNIVQGKTYDLTQGHGKEVWGQIRERLASSPDVVMDGKLAAEPRPRYGEPILIQQRLGQGTFRVIVTDAYQRRCAVTQEKTLPVLEAAHIKPFSESGPHRVQNGLLLRSDIHRLFDAGYVTVTTSHRFEVSKRIHEEFENGGYYYGFHGKIIYVPREATLSPDREYLDWHNQMVFKG